MNKTKGFTIIELIVSVIIIGLIAAFAIPRYAKSIDKGHERDIIMQLKSIHAGNSIYEVQTGGYYLPGAAVGISDINTNLKLNIISNNATYTYTPGSSTAYSATGAYSGGTNFTVRVNQTSLSGTNPCCSAGSCPTLPAC